ncbi:hypothetical protein [Niabella aquatica]
MMLIRISKAFLLVIALMPAGMAAAQYVTGKGNDATMPLHLMKPDYDIPYGETTTEKVKQVLDRVYHYLHTVTPAQLVHKQTGADMPLAKADGDAILRRAISG